MDKNKKIKAAKKSLKTVNKNRIAELEERVQELEIKNALLKELASMKKDGLQSSRTSYSPTRGSL